MVEAYQSPKTLIESEHMRIVRLSSMEDRVIKKSDCKWPQDWKTALEWAIEKWELIARHDQQFQCKTYNTCADSCALCNVGNDEERGNDADCAKCPVGMDGHEGCDETPWQEYAHAPFGRWEACVKAANREVEYLKGLRKEVKG